MKALDGDVQVYPSWQPVEQVLLCRTVVLGVEQAWRMR